MAGTSYPKGAEVQFHVLFEQETGWVAHFCQLKILVFALMWASRQGCRRMLPVEALIHLCWWVRQSRDEFS